ncbi:hypothetical protein FTX61_10605 [Nitriliruptoraceae bacterium ZYF776]|nr:hypothetical protein [Profundirhabdus halotolerans]
MVGRDAALRALRHRVTGREFAYATVLEVTDGGPNGFLLRVRAGQRRHPHILIVAADEQSLTLDHLIGEPLESDDAEAWADGVYYWLMEELDTGVLRRGRRVTLDDGTMAVDPSLETDASSPPWDVSAVPLDRPTRTGRRRLRWTALRARRRSFVTIGGHIPHEPDPTPGGYLQEAGFDVTTGRAAHAEGRLIEWLQLFANERHASALLGQLVVSWRDEHDAVAQLKHLECGPQTPQVAVEQLVLAGVHDAADTGARWIEHRFHHTADLDLGLPWQSATGVMRLDTACPTVRTVSDIDTIILVDLGAPGVALRRGRTLPRKRASARGHRRRVVAGVERRDTPTLHARWTGPRFRGSPVTTGPNRSATRRGATVHGRRSDEALFGAARSIPTLAEPTTL